MSDATQPRSLVKKIAEVMLAVGGVPKTGYNSFHKYSYAKETDILDAVRDELAKRHVILVPSVESFEIRDVATQKGVDRLTSVLMRFTAMDGESGETFAFGMLGQGQDPGDKGAYKAETGAEKYAVKKLFMLGDDESDPEADAKTDESHAKKSKAAPAPKADALPKLTPQADVTKMVTAFAGLGVTPEALATRLGHPLTEVTHAEFADMRKFFDEKRKAATETAEAKALRLEQEAAEKGIADEAAKPKTFFDEKPKPPPVDSPVKADSVERTKVFAGFVDRIRAAATVEELIQVGAVYGAANLAPSDLKALQRTYGDRLLILQDAAKESKRPRIPVTDVPA
jgi:hypothetical protein